ncbi:TGBp1 family protein [Lactococcus lactis]|uniref:UvrD-helicase domain-containing protein n=1 Tax=Lactococcus lactis TaxID=1358 RepID=UPI0024172C04|nr:UvrD-helicase domain-containing protein [Lactococcus lactis]MDG4954363.1 TGBp1 family protein [Lactococcus lactis]
MDRLKQVIHAVAGSGKTSLIIDEVTLEKDIAIITYTTSNQKLLKDKVIKKFGYLPDNIHIFGFWQFIYGFCLVPCLNKKPKGIIYDDEIKKANKFMNNKLAYGTNGYIFDSMISKFLFDYKIPYLERIDEFFDEIYIDEFQDFDSYDLDWLLSLAKIKTKILLVGDYYQRTYSTSKFGNKNSAKMKSFNSYKASFEKAGYIFNYELLGNSHRCSPEICGFISEKLGIAIDSHKENGNSLISIINGETEILSILKDDSIKKLFLKEHYKYNCNSENWGESKGQTYENVCVILNPTSFKLFKSDKLMEMKPIIKSKFYVACTRSIGNLYFIEQKKIPKEIK